MDGPRLTRRQAVRLGAGAAALGALRLPSPAFAARRRRCSSSPSTSTAARTPPPPAGARRRCSRAPRRFDLVGLAGHAGTPQAQVRARTAGGRWTRWTPLPHNHAGDRDRSDPVFTGSADEFQLRLRGGARGLRARFVRALPHAPAPVPARRAPDQCARDHPAPGLGRRQRPAAQRPELRRRADGVRAPHGLRGRLRAGGIGRDHPRHRALPPRLQRLERHRLQLPRRPLRRRSSRAARAASRPRWSAPRRRATTATRPASPASARSRTCRSTRPRWSRSRG